MRRGFTTIEIITAIAISGIVVTIVALSFGKLNDNRALDKAALTAISAFDEARSLALSSSDGNQYGVNIQSMALDQRVAVRNISLTGGGSNVYFKKLTGTTDQTGTFEIYLKASTTMYRKINIAATGLAEEI